MANLQKRSGSQRWGGSRIEPAPHSRRCRRRRVRLHAAAPATGSSVSRRTTVTGLFLLSAAGGSAVAAFHLQRDNYHGSTIQGDGAGRRVELPTTARHGTTPWFDTGSAMTYLNANAPGSGGSSPSVGNGGNSSPLTRQQKTARESAVLVEWEPVSELERRIEDGVHYEHFPDDEHLFGSEDAMRRRRKAAAARGARHGRGGGGGSRGKRGDVEEEDADNAERVRGVFCGFTVTKEEVERLRSANLDDSALQHMNTDDSSYSI